MSYVSYILLSYQHIRSEYIHKLRNPPTLQQSHNPSSGPPRGKTGGSHPGTHQNQNLNLSPLKHLFNPFQRFWRFWRFLYCFHCFPLRSKTLHGRAVPSLPSCQHSETWRRKLGSSTEVLGSTWMIKSSHRLVPFRSFRANQLPVLPVLPGPDGPVQLTS